MTRFWFSLLTMLGACVLSASANSDQTTSRIVIVDGWTRPTGPGMPMGVAYFTIINGSAQDDAVIGARTPVAARVEMHETRIADGMASMRPLREILVPARGRVSASPGGIHLMLVDLKSPLTAGTRVPLVLEFRRAGPLALELSVEMRSD